LIPSVPYSSASQKFFARRGAPAHVTGSATPPPAAAAAPRSNWQR
jgi:hypothetical protein